MACPWNWSFLSYNKNITLEFIFQNPAKDWNWHALSKNGSLDIRRDILANKTLPWKWYFVIENPSITIDIITDPVTIDVFTEYGYALVLKHVSLNPSITMDDIIAHPELNIDISYVCKNPNLTIEFVKANRKLLTDKNYSHLSRWEEISSNPGIKLRDIIENPDLPWSYSHVLMNPNITYHDVINNLQIPTSPNYSYKGIAPRPKGCDNGTSVTWSQHTGLKLSENDTAILFQNVTVPFAVVLANIELFADYFENVSSNAGTQLSDITDNPDFPWSWLKISMNPNLTLDFVLANPDRDWDWYWISRNPNIMLDELCNLMQSGHHYSNIIWNSIYANPFTASKQKFLLDNYRRHLASYRIQQHWHRIRSDPRHPVGKKRLELDYNRDFGVN